MIIARDGQRHRVNQHAKKPVEQRGKPLHRDWWEDLREIAKGGVTSDSPMRWVLQLAGLIQWTTVCHEHQWELTRTGEHALRTGQIA